MIADNACSGIVTIEILTMISYLFIFQLCVQLAESTFAEKALCLFLRAYWDQNKGNVEIKSVKFPGMLVATVILFQVGDADAKQELRDYSFQQDKKLATETYAQVQKPWELDHPRKQERHVQHPIERKNGSSNTTKSSSGFQHSVRYEFFFC